MNLFERGIFKTFILLIFICLLSCEEKVKTENKRLSSQDSYKLIKAKKLIAQYLSDTLLHGRHYKSIEFGNLDSTFSNCLYNKPYLNLLVNYFNLIDSFDLKYNKIFKSNLIYKTDTNVNADTLLLMNYLNSIDSVSKLMKHVCKETKTEFIGWAISNQIEVNDALNVKRIVNTTFYFDTSILKIIKYFDDYQANERFKNFKQNDISKAILKRHLQYRTLKF